MKNATRRKQGGGVKTGFRGRGGGGSMQIRITVNY